MMKRLFMAIMICAALSTGAFAGCASASETEAETSGGSPAALAAVDTSVENSSSEAAARAMSSDATSSEEVVATTVNSAENGVLDTAEMFTDRDLTQAADTSNAKAIALASGQDVTISEEGVYVVSGTAEDATITVDADSSAKVQIVLDGATITNTDAPAIYVASADKVFVTTAEGSTNTLTTTGEFAAIGDDNVDGVIFASDDVVLNGLGTLVIESSANGIAGKDDVKITGGTYEITAANHGIEGKDSVAIADGSFTITAGKDAIHAENSDDQTLGYVYIANGTFALTADSDGIEGDAAVQIDGGAFTIQAAEGIEGTYVQLNDGVIGIEASDDGINATTKSSAYSVVLEINGGETTVVMAAGDTDALDSNGDLIINGGTVDITAQSAFDFDGRGELNGGTLIVNGEQVTELMNSMMGGGMGGQMGGPGGGMQPQDGMGGGPGGMR